MGLVGLTYFNDEPETEVIISEIIDKAKKKTQFVTGIHPDETQDEFRERLLKKLQMEIYYGQDEIEPLVPLRIRIPRIILAFTLLAPVWLFMFAGLCMFPCSIILPFAVISTVPMLCVKKWREEDLPDMWTAAILMIIVPYNSLTNYIKTGGIKF